MSLSKSEAPRRGPKSSRASPDAKTAIKSVRIETVDSPVFQIADRMREMVSKGELTPGMRLPSTRELSDQFNVNSSSVHRALKRLVKEGLLVRTPYVGTFVASPSSGSKIERLGFYIRNNHTFSRALLEQLTFLAHRKDFILEPFNDTRPEDQANASPPEDLLHEAKSRRIQGLITPSSSPERTKWIDSLPIPTATISTPLHPYGLNWNREALTSSSIERLIQRGCKRPGIITSLYERPFPNTDSYQTAVYRGYIKALKKAKLPLNERRIVGAEPIDKNFPDRSTPEFGYHSFQRIWEDLPPEERPDGVFIFPDSLIPGVLLAASNRGLRIPQELRLVIHCHREIPVFCPYSVDRLEVSVAETAIALVQHIENQLLNRPSKIKHLPFQLVPEKI